MPETNHSFISSFEIMRYFLRKLFLFLSLTTILYIVVVILLGNNEVYVKKMNFFKNDPGRILIRLNEINKIKNLEIIILGSSKSFMGIDPRLFNKMGHITYNFGSTAQTPIQSDFLFDRFLKKLPFKLVILEVAPELLANDGIESTTDLINSLDINYDLIRMAYNSKNIGVINTINYKILSSNKNSKIIMATNDSQGLIKNTGYYPGGGTNNEATKMIPKSTLIYREAQLAALRNLVWKIRKLKKKVILVQCPNSKNQYNSLINRCEFDEIMKHTGFYIDFNRITRLNDFLDFSDNYHLNSAGSEKFTKSLINVLKQKKYI